MAVKQVPPVWRTSGESFPGPCSVDHSNETS